MIGDEVEIIIVDVRGDKVRLGITAPKHIPVHRREIYDAIQKGKQKQLGEQKKQQDEKQKADEQKKQLDEQQQDEKTQEKKQL